MNVRWLKPFLVPIAVWLDDKLGHGVRNPVKKWWLDLEMVDGKCVHPPKGVNQRDLNLDHQIDPAEQKMAYYHADVMPPPDSAEPVPIDRKDALKARELLETPHEALARVTAGTPKPAHYIPVPQAVPAWIKKKSLQMQSGTNLGDMEPRLLAYYMEITGARAPVTTASAPKYVKSLRRSAKPEIPNCPCHRPGKSSPYKVTHIPRRSCRLA